MAPLPGPLSSHTRRTVSFPISLSPTFKTSLFNLKRHPLNTLTARSPVSHLSTRQSSALIPANYTNANSGPPPGTVVGIVLGSVFGFILLLWLLYTCFGGGPIAFSFPGFGRTDDSESVSVVVRERKRGSHRTHSTRSRRVSEVREVRVPAERVRVVETEERRTRTTRAPPPPAESSLGTSEADEVVVIEEHSPPPRRRESKRESGYRTVDPGAFGGGDRPLRKVSGGSRR